MQHRQWRVGSELWMLRGVVSFPFFGLGVLLLIAALAGPAGAAGPDAKHCAAVAGIKHPKELVAFVGRLQKAVRDGDRAAVIAMMDGDYPVEFSGNNGEVHIADAEDFLKRYESIMTQGLRDGLLGLKSGDIMCFREGAFLSGDAYKRLFATEESNGKITYYFRP